LQKDLVSAVSGLIGVAIGSIPIAIMAYYHIKHDRAAFMGQVLRSASTMNKDLLGDNRISRPEAVRQMIMRGESVDQEFKGSLRTNLKTGEVDRRMEQAVLKTIAAFLNSDGGTLFVGVNDDGSARGIDVQHFDNQDKFLLHFTNLVNETIGKRFLPFIEVRLVDLDNITVMAVRCSRCNVPAFLKMDKEEVFYVRAGASSTELKGREMIDYVNQRFRA
jgi:predicted HTH transcriptional regulator